MNEKSLHFVKWNKKNYQEFINYLYELQDLRYQQFQSKLILNEIPLIGIRIPILKKISKQLSKGDYKSFIKYNSHLYFEEIILYGLVLSYLKIDFKTIIIYLNDFLPFNSNWAINDTVCASLKIFSKNREEGFKWILEKLHSNNPWDIRFAFILLLDHYMVDEYIDDILQLVQTSYINHYYVNMAIAWLLSICYIKYPEKTIMILENKKLDIWIHNKTISKIRDSYRVTKDKKDYLKTLIR